ncbi:MAG: ComEC/Rec2 family competence protein, partial [Muribaculaceae bacterium]|nr:ComEC/Rec2 family competence protein [Muribaculaceae bacterium]
MQKGPLIPTLSLAAGIATSAACQVPWWCGIFPIAIAVTLYSLILKASKDPVASIRFGKWHIIWVILLFAGIGVLDESLNRPLTLQNAFGRNIPETLYCEVTGIQTKTYGERIDVIIDGTNGAKARIRSGVTEISPGDIIIIPSMYLKHISSDTTKTGIRLQPMLKAKGIIYTCILNPKQIKIAGKSSGLRYFFIDIREKIEREIERSHLNKTTADFLKAILMGDKAGLDESARLTFANGGMAHMLALSGMHIGILAGLLLLLMWPIKLTGHYKLVYAAALILLWAYIAVTGMAYSSVRAGI